MRIFFFLLVFGTLTHAQEVSPDHEPELVLVLSGGGARGAAHIGVLKALEEMRIMPDMIIGTSMGSIIGGLYASGWAPEDIEDLLSTMDWNQVFSDSVPRNELVFRRKQDDRPFLVKSAIHFDAEGLYKPPGILGGQSLMLLINSLEAYTGVRRNLEDLPIPFKAIASDIETGEIVVLETGRLSEAMRASMAIPALFAPVKRDGRILTDGGSVANLPIGVAKSFGAKRIIAVDISSPLMGPKKKLNSFLAVFKQMNSLLTVGNRERDIDLLDDGDVFIRPKLDGLGFLEFERAKEAVEKGAKATQQLKPELQAFSLSEAEWQARLQQHRRSTDDQIRIGFLNWRNATRLSDDVFLHALDIRPPTTLDIETLNAKLLKLYNLKHSGVMTYSIEGEEEEKTLVLEGPAPAYSPNTLRVGLSFSDDFEGEAGYAVTARHLYYPANRLGGEWENVAQIGSTSLLSSLFYQPLNAKQSYFFAPSFSFSRGTQAIWLDGNPLAEYRLQKLGGALDFGRVLSHWGEVRLSLFHTNVRGRPRIGDPIFIEEKKKRAGFGLSFRVDTEDKTVFPNRGMLLQANYEKSNDGLGADFEFEQFQLHYQQAWQIGNFVTGSRLEYGENNKPTSSFFNLYFLGGPGRLSGLGHNELYGEKFVTANVNLRRSLKDIHLRTLLIQIHAGVTLEAGNVFLRNDSIHWDGLRTGGSFFLAADTPMGPFQIIYGITENGRNAVYFTIGQSF